MKLLTTTALVALLAAPMTALPVLAQSEQAETQTPTETAPQSDTMQSGGDAEASPGDAPSADNGVSEMPSTETPENGTTAGGEMSETAPDMQQDNPLLVTVDGTEIKGEDVMRVLSTLPPQVRSQPAQMLVPMAVEQLILRELILKDAQAQDLGEDPEVATLMDENPGANEDDAVVQVYLQREMEGVVTDEEVQRVYDEAASSSDQDLPPLEQVRPQIAQQLQQEKLGEISDRLKQDVEIVYYGPDGKPMEATATVGGDTNEDGSNSGSETPSGDSEAGTSTDDVDAGASDNASGEASSEDANGAQNDGSD